MATISDLRADLVAAIALFPGGPTRLSSDLRRDAERVPSGATRFALSAFVAGEAAVSSNTTRHVVAVRIGILHSLTSAASERAFTEGALDTMLASLAQADWWRALASVYGLVEDALPEIEVDRAGNIVRVEVSLRLTLK